MAHRRKVPAAFGKQDKQVSRDAEVYSTQQRATCQLVCTWGLHLDKVWAQKGARRDVEPH